MLFGRPPFQTKEVKTIYQNIKELKYSFPEDTDVSPLAMDLIRRILTTDPSESQPHLIAGTLTERPRRGPPVS